LKNVAAAFAAPEMPAIANAATISKAARIGPVGMAFLPLALHNKEVDRKPARP
jgi:hypothetical protein